MSEIPFSFFHHHFLGQVPAAARPVAQNARAPIARGRCNLLGMPLNSVSETEALAILDQRISRGQGTWVLTPNLDILRQYHTNPRLRALFHADEGGADLLLADGMPLIWASRLAGRPLPERVPGSGLVVSLAERAAKKGWSIYLLGGAEGAAEGAARMLTERFPGLKIAGIMCPEHGFDKNSARLAEVREQVAAAKPDIVYVALGFPKQEFVTRYLRHKLPNATFIGVGISLSFLAGDVKRAPRWVQKAGLEWVHRLVQEPRRLAGRYLVHDAPFALFHLFPRALAERWNPADKRGVHLADWRVDVARLSRRAGSARNPAEFSEGRADYEGYHSRRRPGHAPQPAHEGD